MLISSLLSAGCVRATSKSEGPNSNTAGEITAKPTSSATEQPASPGETPDAAHREPSLVSLASGAFPITTATEWSGSYSVVQLLDENSKSGWTSADHHVEPQFFVIALPERTLLKRLEFDCTISDGSIYKDSCARDVAVEMSDTNENDGYQKIAEVSLKEGATNQSFPVSPEVPGRWVRLTVKNNHGHDRVINLDDFRAYGTQLTHTPLPDVSGTYDSGYGYFNVRQDGASVSGCYYTRGGVFEGGLEGPVVKLNWCEVCGTNSPYTGTGTAILVFSPDRTRFIGLWWGAGKANEPAFQASGTRKSGEIGKCPQWANGAEELVTKDLEAFSRARVYGINFDSDSDHIKDESKPTLDKIVSMLKAKPDWKLTIEGHTDSLATPQHNQDLSERRAASVKNYLQSGGIDTPRLKTIGYGQTKPVASNDSELGRAQNRRVELTKQ